MALLARLRRALVPPCWADKYPPERFSAEPQPTYEDCACAPEGPVADDCMMNGCRASRFPQTTPNPKSPQRQDKRKESP